MSAELPHFLSLGAGVQSSTIALMAAAGEITPMPKAAIFADTEAEPASVYKWLEWLEPQLPFPVYRVTYGSLTKRSLTKFVNRKTGRPYIKNMVPAFVKNQDGSKGIVGRRCTYDHKIIPITRKVRELAPIKRGQSHLGAVQWIGISFDEIHRMKPSRDKWSQHRWPLIEMEMTRSDCVKWMQKNGFPKPPRSACVYCPFHSDHEWRRLKNHEPAAFAVAVKFEQDLQALHSSPEVSNRMMSVPFLHDSLKPLGEIDFSEDTTQGQFKWGNECEGMCGV
jgi:hypothetical protein